MDSNEAADLLLEVAEDKRCAGLRPILGGVHVKDLPGGRCVDVLRRFPNWRVVRSDENHLTMDRGWCYAGLAGETFIRAVGEALAWDGADDTEPDGWIKRVHPISVRPDEGD